MGMWRYTSLQDLFNIIKAAVFSTLVVFAVMLFTQKFYWVSRSIIIIIDCVFAMVLISSFRICLRLYFELDAVIKHLDIQEILIAAPSASSKQMRAIVAKCKSSGLLFRTLPGMGELIDGKVTINAVREVAYRDLLGREVVRLEEDRIGGYLESIGISIFSIIAFNYGDIGKNMFK